MKRILLAIFAFAALFGGSAKAQDQWVGGKMSPIIARHGGETVSATFETAGEIAILQFGNCAIYWVNGDNFILFTLQKSVYLVKMIDLKTKMDQGLNQSESLLQLNRERKICQVFDMSIGHRS